MVPRESSLVSIQFHRGIPRANLLFLYTTFDVQKRPLPAGAIVAIVRWVSKITDVVSDVESFKLIQVTMFVHCYRHDGARRA